MYSINQRAPTLLFVKGHKQYFCKTQKKWNLSGANNVKEMKNLREISVNREWRTRLRKFQEEMKNKNEEVEWIKIARMRAQTLTFLQARWLTSLASAETRVHWRSTGAVSSPTKIIWWRKGFEAKESYCVKSPKENKSFWSHSKVPMCWDFQDWE